VNALGELKFLLRLPVLQLADRVHPGASRVHDDPGANLRLLALARERAPDDGANHPDILLEHSHGGCGSEDRGAVTQGAACVGQGQSGVVGHILRVDNGSCNDLGYHPRFLLPQAGQFPDLVPLMRLHVAQLLVGPHACAHLGQFHLSPNGDDHGHCGCKVGRDLPKGAPLHGRLADDEKVPHGQIPEPTVYEL